MEYLSTLDTFPSYTELVEQGFDSVISEADHERMVAAVNSAPPSPVLDSLPPPVPDALPSPVPDALPSPVPDAPPSPVPVAGDSSDDDSSPFVDSLGDTLTGTPVVPPMAPAAPTPMETHTGHGVVGHAPAPSAPPASSAPPPAPESVAVEEMTSTLESVASGVSSMSQEEEAQKAR
eukprot:COSAG01_NODE_34059_length_554_cov_1.039560_1_plen_176_part_01